MSDFQDRSASAESISPRVELGTFIGSQPGRLGQVYNRAGMTPAEIAEDLGVSTSGFVSNNRQTIAAVLDGFVPTSASIRRASIAAMKGLQERGRGTLSQGAMRLLTTNLERLLATQGAARVADATEQVSGSTATAPDAGGGESAGRSRRLNPILLEIAESALAEGLGTVARIVDEQQSWLALEETGEQDGVRAGTRRRAPHRSVRRHGR